MVLSSLKWTRIPTLPKLFLPLSLRHLVQGTFMWMLLWLLVVLVVLMLLPLEVVLPSVAMLMVILGFECIQGPCGAFAHG